MSPRRGRTGGSRSTRTIVLVGVALLALVAIDVALVSVAVGRTAPARAANAGPIPTFSSTPQPSPTASSTSRPSASASAGAATAGGSTGVHRLVSAVDATEAWRAQTGGCGGSAPTLEHTTDGGSTWSAVSFGTLQVDEIAAVRSTSAQVSVLAGVGSACSVEALTSSDGGTTWAVSTDRGAAGAGVVGGTVYLTSGTTAPPCADPSRVFQGATTTAVVCSDTLEWRDGSGSWVAVPVQGIAGITANGSRYTIAETGVASCSGVAVDTLSAVDVTASSTPNQIACVKESGKTVAAGTAIGFGQDGSAVWLWDGDSVKVSTDGGSTW